MNGREVYKSAVRSLTDGAAARPCRQPLHRRATCSTSSPTRPTCASWRRCSKRFDIPMEKCWLNLQKYGNTSSASLPMTLDEANRAGRLNQGDLIAMMAIGAGMAWGSAMVRW